MTSETTSLLDLYGREAAAYVQSLGLKAVAVVLVRLYYSRSPERTSLVTFYLGRVVENIDARFSAWTRWVDRGSLSDLSSPGVYAIAWSQKDLTSMPWTWCEEIIYFGVADHLGKRLRQFDDTISRKRTSHGGADRVLYKYQEYLKLTPNLYLAIAAIGTTLAKNLPDCWRRKGDARRLEYHCIAEYLERYERLPVFNNQNSPKFSKRAMES